MSHLIVVGYPDVTQAARVLAALRATEQAPDLEDAVFVTRTSAGKVRMHGTQPAEPGMIRDSVVDLLVGLLFMHPLLGLVDGPATATLASRISELGISEQLTRELAATLVPGSSLLFIVVRRAAPEQLVQALAAHGGVLLRASLPGASARGLYSLVERAHQAELRALVGGHVEGAVHSAEGEQLASRRPIRAL